MRRVRNVDNAELPRPTAGEKSRQENINLFLVSHFDQSLFHFARCPDIPTDVLNDILCSNSRKYPTS